MRSEILIAMPKTCFFYSVMLCSFVDRYPPTNVRGVTFQVAMSTKSSGHMFMTDISVLPPHCYEDTFKMISLNENFVSGILKIPNN